MPKIKPITEDEMKAAYAMLADAIRSYEPDRLDENTVKSLRFMLKHDNFAPIRDVIMDKLIDIGEYFRNKEERVVKTNLEGKPLNKPKRPTDNRKRKKKVANAGDVPEGSTPGPSISFVQDPKSGILLPVK
jgi:hypothetical protein